MDKRLFFLAAAIAAMAVSGASTVAGAAPVVTNAP